LEGIAGVRARRKTKDVEFKARKDERRRTEGRKS